jgi:hypothetical protein
VNNQPAYNRTDLFRRSRWNSCSGSLELLFRLAGTPVPARWNSCSGSLELLFQLKPLPEFMFFRSHGFRDRKNIKP